MRRLFGVALILGGLSWLSALACGGVCTGNAHEYVSDLERWAYTRPLERGPAFGDVSYALKCLAQGPEDPSRWAGPIAAQHFLSLRESPLRPRITAACAHYLDIPHRPDPYERGLAFKAAYALAMYGVPRVGEWDILGILLDRTRADRETLPYFALAAIGDPRVFPLLRATYDSLCTLPRSSAAEDEKIQLVNCLYHIPGDSVLSFVGMIASTDWDSVVAKRARHVMAARQE